MDVLQNLYLEAPISDLKGTTIDQRIAYFCKALSSIRDLWVARFGYNKSAETGNTDVEQLVFATLDYLIKASTELFEILEDEELKIHYSTPASKLKQSYPSKLVSHSAKLDDCSETRDSANISNSPLFPWSLASQVTESCSPSKHNIRTTEALKPEGKQMTNKTTTGTGSIMNANYVKNPEDKHDEGGIPRAPPPPVMPLKGSLPNAMPLKKVPPPTPPPPPIMPSKRLESNDMLPEKAPVPLPPPAMPSKVSAPKAMPLKKGPPPPPPPLVPSKGSVPNAMPTQGPTSPPPPQLGGCKSLFQNRTTTKLKRSTKMPNLFRDLKAKMEGSSLTIKVTNANAKEVQLGGSKGGKEGLAASLAELTKRSTYFQQIEEDIQKYGKSILELKASINSFQTKDIMELVKFRSNIESILQVLTDEAQVLAKFEGFPTKKLDTLRTAAALYSKFDTVVTTLKNWKTMPPLGQLLDKVEKYLSKIKLELDAFERNKDEESKIFKSHSLDFDFHIVTKIKESMVDLSSSCMELALKDWREDKACRGNEEIRGKTYQKTKESIKMLWRVFQLAFRVYSFAGGQDDRAENLVNQLAGEILIPKRQDNDVCLT